MSNETKRDVFEDALRALEEFGEQGSSWEMAYDDLSARYSAASDDTLPDDLPVIPETVGKYIKEAKFEDVTLLEALGCARDPVFKNLGRWITSHSEEFALAWVLGIWRVEETGEIVKLEE